MSTVYYGSGNHKRSIRSTGMIWLAADIPQSLRLADIEGYQHSERESVS